MPSKRKSYKFIIGLAVAAVLPLSLFLIMRTVSDGSVNIPNYYRVDQIDSQELNGKIIYDTTFHKVRDIVLTNQIGKEVSLNEDLKGKILVVNFIFTSCPTICPALTSNVEKIQKSFIKKNPDLAHFISITVDPWRDSAEVLRDYADQFNADHDRWWFLTGDPDDIFDYARNELGLRLQPSDANKGMYDHSDKIVLLDTARNIRGYYDGLELREGKRVADDIIILSMEKRKK